MHQNKGVKGLPNKRIRWEKWRRKQFYRFFDVMIWKKGTVVFLTPLHSRRYPIWFFSIILEATWFYLFFLYISKQIVWLDMSEYDPQQGLAGLLICIIKKCILGVKNHARPPALRNSLPPSHYFTEHINFKVYVYKYFVVFLMLLAFWSPLLPGFYGNQGTAHSLERSSV